jgi:hypothetical protein
MESHWGWYPYAVPPSSAAATDMSSLTGFFRENDLFFYRHSVPNGTHNPAIMRLSLIGGTTKQYNYYQVFPDWLRRTEVCFTSFAMTKPYWVETRCIASLCRQLRRFDESAEFMSKKTSFSPNSKKQNNLGSRGIHHIDNLLCNIFSIPLLSKMIRPKLMRDSLPH